MYVKELGAKVKIYRYICTKCQSKIIYTEYDILEEGDWIRTGVESSSYYGYKYVICPVCKHKHKIETVSQDF